MNLKKFISENIIDVGSSSEIKNPPKKDVPITPKESSSPKSFINKQEENNSGSEETTSAQNTGMVSTDALTDARNQLAKALADSNQPGTDYYEFVITKNAMSSIPVEEERYKVAFAGLSATGLTKEGINKTGQFYKSVIATELKNFQDQFGQVFRSEVLDKKDAIDSKQKQMVQLSEQINRLNDEIKKMKDDVQRNETSFLMKKNSFEQAAAESQNNIQNELDKINQYIK